MKSIVIITISIIILFGIASLYGGYQWQLGTNKLSTKLTGGRQAIHPKNYDSKELVRFRTEARYRDKLTAMPWVGRFWEYSVRDGMLTPLQGEVGWEYLEGTWLYFKGRTTEIHYEFAS